MWDWLLRRLADRLGVEPASAGEAIVPHIRFEQPWPQAVSVLVVALAASQLSSSGLYRLLRVSAALPLAYKLVPGRAPDHARAAGDLHAFRGRPFGRAATGLRCTS